MLERGHHDMGGQIEEMRAGRIERTEHDYAEWERRIDAMAILLWGIKGGKKSMSVDEHRKNIESLPPQEYDGTSYYEKWIYALTQTLIQRGVISTDELGRKMEEVQRRCSPSSTSRRAGALACRYRIALRRRRGSNRNSRL